MSRNLNRRFYKLINRLTYLERKHLERLIKKKVKIKIGGQVDLMGSCLNTEETAPSGCLGGKPKVLTVILYS